jgi:hypothetical protein
VLPVYVPFVPEKIDVEPNLNAGMLTINQLPLAQGFYMVDRPFGGLDKIYGPIFHEYILHVSDNGSKEAFGITAAYPFGDPIQLRYSGNNPNFYGVKSQPLDLNTDASKCRISPLSGINEKQFYSRMTAWAKGDNTGTYNLFFNNCKDWSHNEIKALTGQ